MGKRSQEQPMNNRIQQGVAPLRATSGARVNADVGSGNILATARTMDLPPPKTKVTNPAETISESEARNSQ